MIDGSEIRQHMEVVGSDGRPVGKVDRVLRGEIKLAKADCGSGLKHHLIPLEWVALIAENRVHLSKTRDDAKAEWGEKN